MKIGGKDTKAATNSYDSEEETEKGSNTFLIAGLVGFVVLLVIAFVIVGVFFFTKNSSVSESKTVADVSRVENNKTLNNKSAETDDSVYGGLTKEQYDEKIKKAKEDGDDALVKQYEKLKEENPEVSKPDTSDKNLQKVEDIATRFINGDCQGIHSEYGITEEMLPCSSVQKIDNAKVDVTTVTTISNGDKTYNVSLTESQGLGVTLDSSSKVLSVASSYIGMEPTPNEEDTK